MFNFLFNPQGRISRSAIWLNYLLPYVGLSIVAGIIDQTMLAEHRTMGEGPVSRVLDLFYLWPSIAVPVKRFHDRGMTGWWVLFSVLLFIPGVIAAFLGFGPDASDLDKLQGAISSGNLEALQNGSPALLYGGLFYICLVAIYFFVVLYVLPGQRGTNKYGPDPLERA